MEQLAYEVIDNSQTFIEKRYQQSEQFLDMQR